MRTNDIFTTTYSPGSDPLRSWKIATDETIDASNGKTVLKTFGTEKDIEKALRRNKMKHLVPMIPMIKNKSMPCPYNLADAIDAANAPKDSEEQK